MKPVSIIMAELTAAGAPPEAVLLALAAIDDATRELKDEIASLRSAADERRLKRTIQKRSERVVSREVAATVERLSRDDGSDNDATVVATVATSPASPPPPKRYNQTPSTSPTQSVEAQAREWFAEVFWPGWVEKVGKATAERAAIKLFRERRGDMGAVIEGRDRYIRDKPADRPWMNPATFLNGKRFEDRIVPLARAGPPNGNGRHRPTMGEMARMDDTPDPFDEPRPHPRYGASEAADSPDQGRSGLAGRLPFADAPYAGRRLVNS